MEKTHILNEVLNRKPKQLTLAMQLINKLSYYFWLYVLVRKKSHRLRIQKARRVHHLLKRPEFKLYPNRLFSYIRTIDPFVFEELLLLELKNRGLKVVHNKRYTGDGGIDGLVILPTQQRIALQAKRYQSYINASHLQDFSESIQRFGCHGGLFIHCGKTGAGVYQKMPSNIILISGANLHRLLVGG